MTKFIPMKYRIFDLVLASVATIILFVPFWVIYLLIRLTSPGPALHWSKRIGKNNLTFLMPKFRTMRIDTPQLATHLLDGKSFLTSIGGFLRKTSLDEIPQLISVLKGDMALVGPRPALFNQDDLKELRTKYNVQTLLPGVTGWAQINGRDELSIPDKVSFDVEYLKNKSLWFDFKILLLTVLKVLMRKGVTH
jgi:O-antigen biosynthesis protein WbqP